MTEEQKARFKELWPRFGNPTNPMNKEELHEFTLLILVVPINLKTGEIPLVEEMTQTTNK